MLAAKPQATVLAIVTDIEGTTTDIEFVSKVLFPYAAARLPDFIRAHEKQPQVAAELQAVRSLLAAPDASLEAVISQLLHWISTDQKITPLKSLQGMVWRFGYQNGDFHGHLYQDVAPCLQQWRQQGIALYVFSSGSVAAQQLLFGHSIAGDLTPLFSGYFDTRTGAKQQPAAYQAIRQQLGLPAQQILFLSDVLAELDAAATDGWRTMQLQRNGQGTGAHPVATNFYQVSQSLGASHEPAVTV
jgi:enolase-phosphatase E1